MRFCGRGRRLRLWLPQRLRLPLLSRMSCWTASWLSWVASCGGFFAEIEGLLLGDSYTDDFFGDDEDSTTSGPVTDMRRCRPLASISSIYYWE